MKRSPEQLDSSLATPTHKTPRGERLIVSPKIRKSPNKFQGFNKLKNHGDMSRAVRNLLEEFDNSDDWKNIEKLLFHLPRENIKKIAEDLNCSFENTFIDDMIILLKSKGLSVETTFIRILCLCDNFSWIQITENGFRILSCKEFLDQNLPSNSVDFKINQRTEIFRSSSDISRMLELLDITKSVHEAYNSHIKLLNYLENLGDLPHILQLPAFLQKYTALGAIIIGLNRAVTLLERCERYEEAIFLLKKLLNLNKMEEFRGHWYERLAHNLSKDPVRCFEEIEMAFTDETIPLWRRLQLRQINDKIAENVNLPVIPITQTIQGTRVKFCFGEKRRKAVWLYQKVLGSVEEFCLHTLLSDDPGSQGVHDEGRLFKSLLVLLFWDCIYKVDVPDVFRSKMQSSPLDWDTKHFSEAREDEINKRLHFLESLTIDQVAEEAVSMWKRHNGVKCLVFWDILPSAEYLKGLVLCFKPESLMKVMRRLIMDHMGHKYGFPDLTLWNTQEKTVRFVEVKGTDKLSTKQILWIQFLREECGFKTDLYHVEASEERHFQNKEDMLQSLE